MISTCLCCRSFEDASGGYLSEKSEACQLRGVFVFTWASSSMRGLPEDN